MGNKVYVGNLPFTIGQAELKALFDEFGEVAEAVVIADKYSGRSKGFGFVTFASDEEAKKAVDAMNEKEIEGRALKVNEARPMEPRE
jgi:RNA recognition motif-containing protein